MSDPVDVYVLGAGASAAHGAPVTDRILPYAFGRFGADDRLAAVADVLRDLFSIDPEAPGGGEYPSLVDVLSVVDMAIDRGDHLAAGYHHERLRAVRSGLEFAILRAIEEALDEGDPAAVATQDLAAALLPNSAVISLNYDVIVDRAIAFRGEPDPYGEVIKGFRDEPGTARIDYGVEFANVAVRPAERIPLLKLHGSFNWLENGVTGDLYYGGLTKQVRFLFEPEETVEVPVLLGDQQAVLALTKADLRPVMITPTHLKDLRNPHISRIWRAAESLLRRAGSVTFIGYSFPGDDIHVKYLFKRALARSADHTPPRIVVVDRNPAVLINYQRFFGTVPEYHPEGFGPFAAGLSGRAG